MASKEEIIDKIKLAEICENYQMMGDYCLQFMKFIVDNDDVSIEREEAFLIATGNKFSLEKIRKAINNLGLHERKLDIAVGLNCHSFVFYNCVLGGVEQCVINSNLRRAVA